MPVVVGLTSLVFSLAHLLPYFPESEPDRLFVIAQVGYTFIFAVIVGVINAKTKSLTIAFSAHVFANLGAVLGFRILFQ